MDTKLEETTTLTHARTHRRRLRQPCIANTNRRFAGGKVNAAICCIEICIYWRTVLHLLQFYTSDIENPEYRATFQRVAEPPSIPVIMSTTSLASVVSIPERINMWQKLKDGEPLVKLHAKFWGKGMLQEEASGQSRLTSGLGEKEDHDIDKSMEDDTDESIEDDTKNGYVLVLGNDAFDIESIWVRVGVYAG